MKKLYFIRHGLTEMNKSGHIAGITETPLTNEGRIQAKAAGKAVKKLNIDLIVCSPIGRTVETAQIIAKEIGFPFKNIVASKLFVERDFGELEGKPWSPDLNLDGFSDLETDDTLIERAHLALNYLHSLDADVILVVSHGSFGRALRFHLKKEIPFTDYLKNAELHHWYSA